MPNYLLQNMGLSLNSGSDTQLYMNPPPPAAQEQKQESPGEASGK